jgi:hypothetical protein
MPLSSGTSQCDASSRRDAVGRRHRLDAVLGGCDVTQRWWGAGIDLGCTSNACKRVHDALAIIYVMRLCVPEFLRTDNLGICPKCQMTFMRYKKTRELRALRRAHGTDAALAGGV